MEPETLNLQAILQPFPETLSQLLTFATAKLQQMYTDIATATWPTRKPPIPTIIECQKGGLQLNKTQKEQLLKGIQVWDITLLVQLLLQFGWSKQLQLKPKTRKGCQTIRCVRNRWSHEKASLKQSDILDLQKQLLVALARLGVSFENLFRKLIPFSSICLNDVLPSTSSIDATTCKPIIEAVTTYPEVLWLSGDASPIMQELFQHFTTHQGVHMGVLYGKVGLQKVRRLAEDVIVCELEVLQEKTHMQLLKLSPPHGMCILLSDDVRSVEDAHLLLANLSGFALTTIVLATDDTVDLSSCADKHICLSSLQLQQLTHHIAMQHFPSQSLEDLSPAQLFQQLLGHSQQLLASDHPTVAMQCLEDALQLHPQHDSVHYQMACCLALQQQPKQALMHLCKALQYCLPLALKELQNDARLASVFELSECEQQLQAALPAHPYGSVEGWLWKLSVSEASRVGLLHTWQADEIAQFILSVDALFDDKTIRDCKQVSRTEEASKRRQAYYERIFSTLSFLLQKFSVGSEGFDVVLSLLPATDLVNSPCDDWQASMCRLLNTHLFGKTRSACIIQSCLERLNKLGARGWNRTALGWNRALRLDPSKAQLPVAWLERWFDGCPFTVWKALSHASLTQLEELSRSEHVTVRHWCIQELPLHSSQAAFNVLEAMLSVDTDCRTSHLIAWALVNVAKVLPCSDTSGCPHFDFLQKFLERPEMCTPRRMKHDIGWKIKDLIETGHTPPINVLQELLMRCVTCSAFLGSLGLKHLPPTHKEWVSSFLQQAVLEEACPPDQLRNLMEALFNVDAEAAVGQACTLLEGASPEVAFDMVMLFNRFVQEHNDTVSQALLEFVQNSPEPSAEVIEALKHIVRWNCSCYDSALQGCLRLLSLEDIPQRRMIALLDLLVELSSQCEAVVNPLLQVLCTTEDEAVKAKVLETLYEVGGESVRGHETLRCYFKNQLQTPFLDPHAYLLIQWLSSPGDQEIIDLLLHRLGTEQHFVNAIASALCGLATQAQRTSVELAVSNKLGKTVKLEDLVQEKKSLHPFAPHVFMGSLRNG